MLQRVNGMIVVCTENETTGHMNTPGIDAGIEPVRLSPGEYSINVQWSCQRDIANPLEYSVELEQPFPVVNHYQNLVMGGFKTVQTLGSSVRVPRQRSVRMRCDDFGYAAPLLNLQTREGDWFRTGRISSELDESVILSP